MIPKYKYTILTLFLAVAFAFGSMEIMNLILKERESQFLTESGGVVVKAPVRAWQDEDGRGEGENSDNAEGEGRVLAADQMAEIIRHWDESIAVTIHSPVSGQISMEDAMLIGKEWLLEMGMAEEGDLEACSIYARLSVAMQSTSAEEELEPYYSFWFVRISSGSMLAFLKINAVTSTVWNADITLYDNLPERMPLEKLDRFVELCGLQRSNKNVLIQDEETTQAILIIDDTELCAEMEFYKSISGLPLYVITDGISEYYDVELAREKVTITFKLTA